MYGMDTVFSFSDTGEGVLRRGKRYRGGGITSADNSLFLSFPVLAVMHKAQKSAVLPPLGFGSSGIMGAMETTPSSFHPASLPESIAPGGESLLVQIAPFGDFPGILDGEEVIQHCTLEAFERVVEALDGEILVDFEHNAETGGSTTAAAWIQSLSIDPKLGLMGAFRFTPAGAEAVNTRQLRFLSPCWLLNEEHEPTRLISVGLTNKPNLPVRPILNRAPGSLSMSNSQAVEDPTTPKPPEKLPSMTEELTALLGLPADADEATILQAIRELCDTLKTFQEQAAQNEAEAEADAHADQIANREAFVKAFVANREAGRAFVQALCKAPAKPKEPVCNSASATAPKDDAQGWKALKTPEERVKWFAHNL